MNYLEFFFPMALRSNAGHGFLILEVSRSHNNIAHTRQNSFGRVISSSQRPLPHNTQHLQQKNNHAPSGIRAHNLSRRAAADLCLRSRGHSDWFGIFNSLKNTDTSYALCCSLIVA